MKPDAEAQEVLDMAFSIGLCLAPVLICLVTFLSVS